MKPTFPFGQPLSKVQQQDRTPKKAFVLGVYASAVHARWVDANGKQKVSALAVMSEPEIFWRGENAAELIAQIQIPEAAGKLTEPTNKNLNGPSGRALDELYLKPLGLTRNDAWLCDLLPESRVNPSQRQAVHNQYDAAAKEYNLPAATIPDFTKTELNSRERRQEIVQELEESKADTLILLGDLPIQWFLKFYCPEYTKLSDFGKNREEYGKPRNLTINGKPYKVLALCHPRQADRLGSSSEEWGKLHEQWISSRQVTS
jgi:uracil-DNA glycosylase